MLNQLNDWAEKLGVDSREPRGIFFILERFHLNHRVAFSDSDLSELLELEETLLQLGAKCVLLTISSDIVEQRIQSSRPQEWATKSKDYIREQSNELLSVQNRLREEARKSAVTTLEINTDDRDWTRYAMDIIRVLE